MDSDLFLVLGALLAALAIPSILASYSEGEPPRVATVLVIIATGMLVTAFVLRPEDYTYSDIPDAFVRVIGRILN